VNDDRRFDSSSVDALAAGAAAVAHTDDLDAALAVLLRAAVSGVGAASGALSLQDPDWPDLQVGCTTGLDDGSIDRFRESLHEAGNPSARAARERVVASGPPTTEGGLFEVAGPLVASRGGIDLPLGVITLWWPEPHELGAAEETLLAAVSDLAAVAIDRARLASLVTERSEWFERMASTDPLTGLANQRTFGRILELEIARAARQEGEVSVALFDVDDFGATNETAGHEVGDDILRSIASILTESVRLVDTVARFGGDEFIVIAPGAAGSTVARRVLEGVARLTSTDGRAVSVSAGVARFPTDGADSETLLGAAHAALEGARTAGRGGFAEAGIPVEG
jgi:diguanylate cyclase (GGDEF)-like protein